MTVSRDAMGWMDFLAFLALRAMASKALQGTRVSLVYLEPRAFQERWVLQDRAYQARRANVASLVMLDFQDLQAYLVLQVPQEPQER